MTYSCPQQHPEQSCPTLDALPLAISEVDCEGRLTRVNSSYSKILGYPRDQIIGRFVWEFMDQEDPQAQGFPEYFKQLVRNRPEPVPFLGRNRRADGSLFNIRVDWDYRFDQAGTLLGFACILSDITQQLRAEQSLKSSNDFLTNVLEGMDDGVIAMDDHLHVTYFNQSSENLLGRKRAEVLNRFLFDVFPEALGSVFHQNYEKALSDRRPRFFEAWFEPHQQWYEVRAYPHPAGITVLFQSTTMKKKTLEELRHQANLLQNVSDAIISTDLEMRIRSWNRAAEEIYGWKAAEVIGEPLDQILATTFINTDALRANQRLMADRCWSGEVVQKHRSGETLNLLASVSLILDSHDKPVGCVTINRNISLAKRTEAERRKLEEQMQHAQKLESLGVLAGGIAHDFNNLLMAILGYADLALFDLPSASPARDNIKEIVSSSRRAADLCKQMLAYSGKGKFVIEAINISSLIEEMCHMLEISISKKAILKYHLHPDLPKVEGDATQIRQVLMNLIINASEAIGDKSGVISITTGAMDCDGAYLKETYLDDNLKEGFYVTLEVSDTGCGMDEITKARVFDPFFTTKFTGRGLGLAAVLGIIRGHHGAIKVYSEPKKGSTFKVLLPAAPNGVNGSKKTDEPVIPAPRIPGKILVVDDEETVRALCRRMLGRLGYEVLLAQDGRVALSIFHQFHSEIACVLLDLTMPHLDGVETFRELRRLKPDVRVIMSSGYNEQEVVQRFAGKGLAGFIQKPYTIEGIKQKLLEVFSEPVKT